MQNISVGNALRRTKQQAAETNCQILLAAEEMFLDRGYDNVSLEEIAALAGVSRGAVHWHFKNKQGLLLALRNTAQEPFRELEAELSASDGAQSLNKLINAIKQTFQRLEKDTRQQGLLRAMLRLDLSFAEEGDNQTATFPQEMYDIFVPILKVVDRDIGLIPPWTAEKAATMLNATMGGIIIEWGFERGEFRLADDGVLLIRTMLRGLIKAQQSD